jgi:hypothetical protein
MTFGPVARRLTYTAHLVSSVGWIGVVLVFLALAVLGLASRDGATVRGTYLVMAPTAWFVLVPLAHAAFFSGVALSLGTNWGLFQHYWVAFKLAITAFSTVILLIYMGTFRQMSGVAADPVVELGLVRNPSPVVHAVLALILLVTATVLAIYKPFGMTPYGERLQRSRQSVSSAVSVDRSRRPGMGWVFAAFVGVLLLIVILHALGTAPSH